MLLLFAGVIEAKVKAIKNDYKKNIKSGDQIYSVVSFYSPKTTESMDVHNLVEGAEEVYKKTSDPAGAKVAWFEVDIDKYPKESALPEGEYGIMVFIIKS